MGNIVLPGVSAIADTARPYVQLVPVYFVCVAKTIKSRVQASINHCNCFDGPGSVWKLLGGDRD